ncbi:NAD(P)/FAD-dependent oxidoreductase [bacterium]|nr:NAD(P)/FAD-dependent oxidoreductase [bacterium]
MSEQTDILVVGGGPAGLMSAITAAEAGARVALLERLAREGTKLAATGGGRCNLTNTLATPEFLERFGKRGKFMRPAFAALSPTALRDFLLSLGVKTHTTDGFHVFPVSESALEIRDALSARCRELGVQVQSRMEAQALLFEDMVLRGVETPQGHMHASKVILAAGGCAWPGLGSNGSGFEMARAAGHTIVRPVPALVPLVTRQKWPRRCTGIVIPAARLRIDLPKAPRAGVSGDLLFTHRGLSGPVALDLSGEIARHLADDGKPVPLRLHLTDESNPEAWAARIAAWTSAHPRRQIRSLVAEHLPRAVADEFCSEAGVADDLRAAYLPRPTALRLAEALAGIRVDVAGTEGFEKGMVSSGGITTREIDPVTLQSRLVEGLYFAGEILDVDGPCGGFNLQWAFSSGRLAGHAAANGPMTHGALGP